MIHIQIYSRQLLHIRHYVMLLTNYRKEGGWDPSSFAMHYLPDYLQWCNHLPMVMYNYDMHIIAFIFP